MKLRKTVQYAQHCNVHCGSKAALTTPNPNFRFAPERGLKTDIAARPKSAKPRHEYVYSNPQSLLYLEVASGSIPLILIASDARAEARNSIRRLEPSICFEPATTAAENTEMNWISGG